MSVYAQRAPLSEADKWRKCFATCLQFFVHSCALALIMCAGLAVFTLFVIWADNDERASKSYPIVCVITDRLQTVCGEQQ